MKETRGKSLNESSSRARYSATERSRNYTGNADLPVDPRARSLASSDPRSMKHHPREKVEQDPRQNLPVRAGVFAAFAPVKKDVTDDYLPLQFGKTQPAKGQKKKKKRKGKSEKKVEKKSKLGIGLEEDWRERELRKQRFSRFQNSQVNNTAPKWRVCILLVFSNIKRHLKRFPQARRSEKTKESSYNSP